MSSASKGFGAIGLPLVAVFVGITLFGTVGFTLIEHLSFVDAFYFTIVTIATVGYGNIHPL